MKSKPQLNPYAKNCFNCKWWLPEERKENQKMRMLSCHNPDKITLVEVDSVIVEGVGKVASKICSGWTDCGLVEKGLLKPAFLVKKKES